MGIRSSFPMKFGPLDDGFIVCANGSVFTTKSTRTGVLPRMLNEILTTRIMVKREMKKAAERGDRVLYRILDARQFALKMISNVTYGYCGASFSGRMPCSQIADAIVEVRVTRSYLAYSIAKWIADVYISIDGQNDIRTSDCICRKSCPMEC